jgi:dipeptidyl-peptidase-4
MRNTLFLLFIGLSHFSALAQTVKKQLTLQEIWGSRTFAPAFVQGFESMSDGKHYIAMESDESSQMLVKYSYASGEKVGVIWSSNDYSIEGKPLGMDSYTFSSDESKLLVPTETEPLYRYSSRSHFVVIDLKTKTASYLSKDGGKQAYATFSPDGKKVAFVRDNNLFVKFLDANREVAVTTDGKWNEVINGASDWVYEEEFALKEAYFWSPDSRKLGFIRFDETRVKEFNMATYGSLYPGEYRYKYPKAGEENARVSAFVYDAESGKSVKVETGDDPETYLPRLTWNHDGSKICVTRMNRLQNHLELLLADPSSGAVTLLLEENSKTYIDIHDNLKFLSNGKQFLWTSELDGWNRAYLYDIGSKKPLSLSNAGVDITEVYGLDEKNAVLWYQAAWPNPMSRTVFSVKLNGKGAKSLVKAVGHQDAEFSSDFSYVLLTQSSAVKPLSFTLYSRDGKIVRVLEQNKDLQEKLSAYALSTKEFIKIPNGLGDSLNAWMIKPPDFDASKKYPVFMTVYGGPGHNTVEDQWEGSSYLWYNMLAQKGYIVVSVDNRGTQYRGEAFKKSTYMQLGRYETEDQIAAAKYLGTLAYVDAARIGIQGWSYGGYMSSLCITKGADVFKMAIAVAPVTNWRYYDSIYTERFMQLPQNNAAGYDDNSPINHVSRLKGKYLLIHGTADDNVHFQNSVEMVSALVKANKQFDMFMYPDKNHGIYGGNTRLHLYGMMTEYILNNL